MEYLLKEIHTSISNVELERTNENLSRLEKTHLKELSFVCRWKQSIFYQKKYAPHLDYNDT